MSERYTVGVTVTLPREVNLEANGEDAAKREAVDYFEENYPGAEIEVVGIVEDDGI